MRGRGSAFSSEQDAIILSTMKDAKAEKMPQKTVWLKLADDFGTTPQKVENRYKMLNKALRKKNGITPTPRKSNTRTSSRTLSEVDQLGLKLKSTFKDVTRSTQRVNLFKERYEAEKDAHSELKKEYSHLKEEHEKLLSIVRGLLGEDEAAAGEEEYEDDNQSTSEGQGSFGFTPYTGN